MPPIPIYSDSPVAAKPSGVTPKTPAAQADGPKSAAPAPTNTSADSERQTSTYAPAQPGAAPSLPQVTAAPQPHVSSVLPTPTQPVGNSGPPPPQPGAFPTPTKASQLPPPPKAGEKYTPTEQTSAPQPAGLPYPPQMSVPPPTATHPAQQRGTFTASGSSAPDVHSLAHPPGYHQNTQASALDNYQSAAALRNQSEKEVSQAEGDGVWDQAKKWATAAGTKLAAAESEAWRMINKE